MLYSSVTVSHEHAQHQDLETDAATCAFSTETCQNVFLEKGLLT